MGTAQDRMIYTSTIDVGAGMNCQPALGTDLALEECNASLRELVALSREMLTIQREQLLMTQRAEERFQRQHAAQREEFQRWLNENPLMAQSAPRVEEATRQLLGQAISDMVDFIDDHQEDILDSDFVRVELVDRFGNLLNHVSTMYSVVKRLAAAAQSEGETTLDNV